MSGISEAQRRFLSDPRPYVKGGFGSPTVRTMMALQRKGLITVEPVYGGGTSAYETKLTPAGRTALKESKP